MTYRTKRPRTRALLTFGAGATLAIAQLGAGCVPQGRYDDDAGEPTGDGGATTVRTPADASAGARGDAGADADADARETPPDAADDAP